MITLTRKITSVERVKEIMNYINLEIIKRKDDTWNGCINGSYVDTRSYEITKAGDINIKEFTDNQITKLIEEAMLNIKNIFNI